MRLPILAATLVAALILPLRAQPGPVVTGEGALLEVVPGQRHLVRYRVRVQHPGPGSLHLLSVEALQRVAGGWMRAAGDLLATAPVVLGPGETWELSRQEDWWLPAEHLVLRCCWQQLPADPQVTLVAIPLPREGFAPVAAVELSRDTAVGVVAPLEAFPTSGNRVALWVLGQVQQLGARVPIVEVRTRVEVEGSPEVGRFAYPVSLRDNAEAPLQGFVALHWLPVAFDQGRLAVEVRLGASRRESQVHRFELPVGRARPLAVQSPVVGEWFWGNGPGLPSHHVHTRVPGAHLAYDLFQVPVDEGAIDPGRNEDFPAWGQPFTAVLDGVVLAVDDRHPDRPGRRSYPPGIEAQNNLIVLAHGEGVHTSYLHLQQGSATVRPGERVVAGQRLGLVGNAGHSAEPHLHVAAHRVGPTGREQGVFLAPAGLRAVDDPARALEGVPLGGQAYVAPRPVAPRDTGPR